jgi:iron complex outermembrane receptor protein
VILILKAVIIKNRILFTLFFLSTILIFSQGNINGRIFDGETRTVLEGVSVLNTDGDVVSVSNSLGAFEVKTPGTYDFYIRGYAVREIDISSANFIFVQLNLNPSQLNEVVVRANQVPQKLINATEAIDLITEKDLSRGNDLNPISILNRVPGVFMQSGALNTNKITIRGIGSRNLYGTSKIRAYYGDIPITSGNGESAIEDFEFASIARMEILKGASSIYGAGLGGTIQLIPQNSYLNQTDIRGSFMMGSFGTQKSTLNFNHGTKNHGLRAIYSNTHSDGYRENNQYDRQTITLSSNHYLGAKDELTFIGSYVDLQAFIPSSIDRDDFENNPSKAAFTWGQSQGYEDSQRGVFGLSWMHQYKSNLKQITSIYGSFRNNYEPRPFNILKEDVASFGVRSRFLGNTELFQKKLNWSFGGELFRDRYNSKTFENLYKEYPNGTGSVQGDVLSNYKENRSYFNLFVESNYSVSEKTLLSVGLNLNQTYFDLEDNFEAFGNSDQSGSYDFETMISPKFGISHLISKNASIYANISHGFSPPTLEETLLPDGMINTDIEPETGWNYEFGSRNSLLQNRLKLNFSLYRMNIENLLVARRTNEDQYIGVNAGKTIHDGIETSLNYFWIQKENFGLNTYISYSLNDFKFDEFIDDEVDFSGNDLTGVPSDVFNAGLDLKTKSGFYGNLNFQYVGAIPMNDANSLYSESYALTNMKIGYQFKMLDHLELNTFFGVNNIFDTHYASQILINARGFGGSDPRYYYPGNPVNYFTGINLNYMF